VAFYDKRIRCYSIIFEVLDDLDSATVDGSNPSLQRLRSQTYELVYGSDDELFHQALYDWYISRGQAERLLDVVPQLSLSNIRFKLHISKHIWNVKQPVRCSRPISSGNSMPKTGIIIKLLASFTILPIQILLCHLKKEWNISLGLKVCVPFVQNLDYAMLSTSRLQ